MAQPIGSGSYGVVVAALPNGNETFPGNVTKLYSNKEKYDDMVRLIPQLPTLLGTNAGHRMNTYKRTFRGRNISNYSRKRLGISEQAELYPLRMPHLGINIRTVIQEKESIPFLRKCSIPTIIGQIVKLIRQIYKLGSHGYIHGDVREPNIMIQPSDGTLTLIDFDWMKPVDEFYEKFPFELYWNPPEFLFFKTLPSLLTVTDLTDEILQRKMPNLISYSQYFEHFFPFVQHSLIEPIRDTLLKANKKNLTYLKTHSLKSCLSSFDGFGLACILLSLLHRLYPQCCLPKSYINTRVMKDILKTIITNKDEPYTDWELDFCGHAILNLVRLVLLPMASFEIEGRLQTSLALARAEKIYTDLVNGFSASKSLKEMTERADAMKHLAVLEAQQGNNSDLKLFANRGNRRTRRGTRGRGH